MLDLLHSRLKPKPAIWSSEVSRATLGKPRVALDNGAVQIALTADLSESLGGTTLVYGQAGAGETVTLQAAGWRSFDKGERFTAGFDPAQAYLFDKDGRAL